MGTRFFKQLSLPILLIVLVGCTTGSKPSTSVPPSLTERNRGYALLFDLMSDESNVSKLLILKHADEPSQGLVKEVAAFAKDAKRQMEEFRKSDTGLNYEANGLPAVEQEARDRTAKTQAKELLTSSGKLFELRLIFSQAQAMGYGDDIAKILEAHEDNAVRKAFLASVSDRCHQFHDRLMAMLSVKQ